MTFNLSTPAFPWRDRMNDRMIAEVVATGGSYLTGGEVLTAADLGMSNIQGVYGTISNGTAVVVAWFDYTNQKLKLFVPNTGAEVANAVDLSGYTGTLLITGKA